jgi:hypothetical protein
MSGGTGQTTIINLLGCIINGILYGDTSLTGINIISTEVPDRFSLYQNYPNPFNPNTNIKFQIAKNGYAVLRVFDIRGREVTTLVNEQLNPGTYEVEWDASKYSSGVYLYRMTAGEYSATKRMLLMK